MSTSVRRGLAPVALVAALAVLTGCQGWVNRWFDAGNNTVTTAAFGVGNVDELTIAWRAPEHNGALAADGRWYAEGPTGDLEVLALDGSSCPAEVCTPMWSAEGRPVALSAEHVITLVDEGGGAFRLHTVDRGGVDGCSGTPVVCAPRWRSPVIGEPVDGTARVLGDHLVVAEATGPADPYNGVGPARLLGWRDVDAPARCGEVDPDVCPHDWQSYALTLFDASDTFDPARGAVALGAGHAVVIHGAGFASVAGYALDGSTGCTGAAPAICDHAWSAQTRVWSSWAAYEPYGRPYASPVIADGQVFVVESRAALFDADRISSWDIAACAATSQCAASWTRSLGTTLIEQPGIDPLDVRYLPSDPTVLDDAVLLHRSVDSWSDPPYGFPRQDWVISMSRTSGGYSVAPSWRTPGIPPTHGLTVAGGVVFVQPPTGGIAAVDAAGTVGCGSGRICDPLWTSTEATAVRAVVGGRVLADAVGGGTVVFTV